MGIDRALGLDLLPDVVEPIAGDEPEVAGRPAVKGGTAQHEDREVLDEVVTDLVEVGAELRRVTWEAARRVDAADRGQIAQEVLGVLVERRSERRPLPGEAVTDLLELRQSLFGRGGLI